MAQAVGKREIAARLMSRAGLLRLFESFPRYPCLIAINYHRVSNPDDCPYDRGIIEVTPEQFEEQVAYLRSRFHIADPAEIDDLVNRPNQRKHCSVLITFDDGYLDNYEVAFPILKSHGIRGLFFLATSFVGTDRLPWWDRIAYLVRHSSVRRLALECPYPIELDVENNDREDVIRQVLRLYKNTPTADTHRFLKDLELACAVRPDRNSAKRLFMNWTEAREMQSKGMCFGSHTHNHELLANQAPEQQYDELRRSREILQRELSIAADTLAYPVGSPTSFSELTLRAVEDTGYNAAFSYYGGVNLPGKTNRFNLLRMRIDPEFSLARFGLRTVLAGVTGRESL